MEPEYLLDSNVIVGFLTGRIPMTGMHIVSGIVDRIPHISVISQIEVLRYNDTAENEKARKEFINASVIHPLSPDTVWDTIRLCRQHKIKLPDAVIAAAALLENRILVTRNIADFKNIANLKLLNPWEIEFVNP
jgi:predicted nucleic acid-binding protein